MGTGWEGAAVKKRTPFLSGSWQPGIRANCCARICPGYATVGFDGRIKTGSVGPASVQRWTSVFDAGSPLDRRWKMPHFSRGGVSFFSDGAGVESCHVRVSSDRPEKRDPSMWVVVSDWAISLDWTGIRTPPGPASIASVTKSSLPGFGSDSSGRCILLYRGLFISKLHNHVNIRKSTKHSGRNCWDR